MKCLDFINEGLPEKNEARAYIKNADKVMSKYYEIIAERIKRSSPEPQLSDFSHPSEVKKDGKLLLVTVFARLISYSTYKYLK